MPLNPFQREYLGSLLADFFDDVTITPLNIQIENLKRAFAGNLIEMHVLFDFQQCIYESSEYLRDIAKYNADITIGEIQSSILDFSTQKLTQLLPSGGTLAALGWNHAEIAAFLAQREEYNKKFEGTKKRSREPEYEHPYFIMPAGRMFSARMEPRVTELMVKLEVTVAIQPEGKKMVDLTPFPPNYGSMDQDDGTAFDMFLYPQRDKALSTAEGIAQRAIIADFISVFFEKLMTYQYYHHAITNGIIDFHKVRNINETQFNTLTHPVIIARLQSGECNLTTVLGYSAGECIVYTDSYYYHEIKVGNLTLDPFNGIDYEQGRNFVWPPIKNLIIERVINTSHVTGMSPHARAVFEQDFFYHFVKENPHEFNRIKLVNAQQKERLINETILYLLSGKKISIDEALAVTEHAFSLLKHNPMLALLTKLQILKLNELSQIATNNSWDDQEPLHNSGDILKTDPKILRAIVTDFLRLASYNMLYDTDLRILDTDFSHLTTRLYAEEKEGKEEKSSSLGGNLLNYPAFLKACRRNVVLRLQYFLRARPEKLISGQDDKIEKIIEDCQLFNINSTEIFHQEIETQIKNKLMQCSDSRFNDILTHHAKLKVTVVEIWGKYLGMRAFAIFDKKSYSLNREKDDETKLVEDTLKTAESQRVPLNDLRTETIKNLIRYLKSYLEENYDPTLQQTQPFYKKIHAAIINADTEEKAEDSSSSQNPWQQAFATILRIVTEEKNQQQALLAAMGASNTTGSASAAASHTAPVSVSAAASHAAPVSASAAASHAVPVSASAAASHAAPVSAAPAANQATSAVNPASSSAIMGLLQSSNPASGSSNAQPARGSFNLTRRPIKRVRVVPLPHSSADTEAEIKEFCDQFSKLASINTMENKKPPSHVIDVREDESPSFSP